MDLLRQFVDFFIHLDVHLAEIIKDYGIWTYAILFGIIFLVLCRVLLAIDRAEKRGRALEETLE